MTFPIAPLPKLPSAASSTDKNILAPKLRELIEAVNQLDARLAKLEQPTPEPQPEPTPEPAPEPVPDPVPPPPTGSGIAELPRVTPNYAGPTPARIIDAATSDELAAALQTARGENIEIRLAAGVTYVGNFAQTSRGEGWLTLKGATVTARTRPSTAGPLPKLISTNTDPTLRVTGTKFRTEGFEIAPAASVTAITYNIVELQLEAVDLVLVGLYVHGQANSQVQRGIALNCASAVIRDSWISTHLKGFEGQGIGGWAGAGPFLIENNTVEAAGINLLFGGATPSTVGLRAGDITVRRNHIRKDPAWGPPGTGEGPWTEKNLLELKSANRVLIEGNVFENSWQDAQPTGSGIMIKSINDQGSCSWCQTTDVTIRNNYGRNIETPIVLSSAENYNDVTKPPLPVSRVLISSNVFDDAGSTAWGAKGIQLTSGHGLGGVDVQIERTVIAQGAGKLIAHGLLVDPYRGLTRAVFRDLVLSHGAYPILNGQGLFGAAALQVGAPDAVWSNVYFVKSANHQDGTPVMPGGTMIVTDEPPLAAQIRSTVSAATAGVVIAA